MRCGWTHWKKLQLARLSSECPLGRAQTKKPRPRFGPRFFTVLSTEGSLWPLQSGAVGGSRDFHMPQDSVPVLTGILVSALVEDLSSVDCFIIFRGGDAARVPLSKKAQMLCWRPANSGQNLVAKDGQRGEATPVQRRLAWMGQWSEPSMLAIMSLESTKETRPPLQIM